MEDREAPRMCKYGESKTTRIVMATVPHVTSGLGLRKFQADGFLLDRVYHVFFLFCFCHHCLCCYHAIGIQSEIRSVPYVVQIVDMKGVSNQQGLNWKICILIFLEN